MRRFSILVCALSLITAACTMTPAPIGPPPPPGPIAGSCDASAVQWAVGQPASASVLEQVTLASGARSARVLHPGEMVTMEFSADRLTINVDAGNRIIDLNCG
jgi:hypothetical protein